MKKRLLTVAGLTFGRERLAERTVRITRLTRYVSAAIALIKIATGIYSLSPFICVSGLYNVGITAAKHLAVKAAGEREQLRAYRRVGLAITVTSVLYILYALNMALRGKANMRYDIVVSLAIATVTFAEIALAVRGIITARRIKNLAVEAIKRTNLVCALTSLVLTQGALLSLNETENAARYCGATGIVFGVVSLVIGVQMCAKERVKRAPINN
jgi:hypothetical protein